MSNRNRDDEPGAWHHVTNRGIAKRSIFDDSEDYAYFMARIDKVVSQTKIEIYAYCLLRTHFHLLIRSSGRLSIAMRLIENPHARHFNKRRDRDGPLFKGRFFSRRVRSVRHWVNVLRYIDHNPVDAGIVTDPSHYPLGSAYYQTRRNAPKWLLRGLTDTPAFDGDSNRDEALAIEALAGRALTREQANLLEDRLESSSSCDELDEVVRFDCEELERWLRSRARLADGTFTPIVSSTTLDRTITEDMDSILPLDRDTADAMRVGLMRAACAHPLSKIGRIVGFSETKVHRLNRAHRERVRDNPRYRSATSQVLANCLRADWGELDPRIAKLTHPLELPP